jgi:hypothetical protein
MDIIKFTEYLKEAISIPPVLDVVIDDNGIVYDGKIDGTPLIKGNTEHKLQKVTRIFGSNKIDYPAGIDKNGKLYTINTVDVNLNGEIVKIAAKMDKITPIPKGDGYWIVYDDDKDEYYNMVPLTPTGWVNMKIDMEVSKRVRRYSAGLVDSRITHPHTAFIYKLNELKRISNMQRDKLDNNIKIQKEMSVVILLHCLNELKDFFHPSSSGFLFESFLAGLIPGARIKDDNGKADITADGKRYQIKFLSNTTSNVSIAKDEKKNSKGVVISKKYLSYYIICLKYIDKIDVFIIDTTTRNNRADIADKLFSTPTRNIEEDSASTFSVSKMKTLTDDIKETDSEEEKERKNNSHRYLKKYSIDLSNIEGKIDLIGDNLKAGLNGLYNQLSQFQYNVETLISGTKTDGTVVENQEEYELFYNKGLSNISQLTSELTNLKERLKL